MLKKIKTALVILCWILGTVTVLLAVIAFLSVIPNKFTAGFFVVQSGSMEPAISRGSLVMLNKIDNYQQNDVVTYSVNGKVSRSGQLVTHRIIEAKETNQGQNYILKGDANNATDSAVVKKSQILGKVVLTIPLLGYPISFIRTLPGLIIVIVIPATIIIYQEAVNIKNSLKIKLSKKKKEEEKDG